MELHAPPACGLAIIDAPFAPGVRRMEAPAGLTVLDMIEHAGFSPRVARRAVVLIGEAEIPQGLWERVRPKPGVTITVGMRPGASGGGDGGSNPLRVLLQIAVTAASAFLIATGAPFLAAAVSVLGNAAVNALIPPPRAPSAVDNSFAPSYAIEGATNELRLFGRVPCVLGKRRQVLLHAARAFTEVVGDDLYYRMLLTPGVGPAQMTGVKIGATDIGAYQGVEIETRSGVAGEPPVTLFSNTVLETNPGVTLTQTAGYVIRQTDADCDEISVDFTFPNGLAAYDSRGARVAASVALDLRIRPTGGGDDSWTHVTASAEIANQAAFDTYDTARTADDFWTVDRFNAWAAQAATYGPASGENMIFAAAEGKTLRRNLRFAVPRGRYDVEVRRLSADSTSTTLADLVVWSALRTIRVGAPLVPEHTPLLAIRIKASEQLQGQIEPISAEVVSIRRKWTGAGFDGYDFTFNPADLILSVLQGPGNERPQPDSRIDFASLGDFAALCQARGWECGLIIEDGRSVGAVCEAIAATGRARMVWRAGKIGVVVDVPRLTSGQMFTPRNSRNFRAVKTFLPPVHAVRASFANYLQDFRQDERIVYAPGYAADTATLYEELPVDGIYIPDRIYHEVNYHLAVALNRSERFSFECDVEHAVCGRGDVAYLATDVILEGLAQARVLALLDDAGDPLAEDATEIGGVRLDETCPLNQTASFALRVRRPSATSVWPVNGGPEDSDTLYFTTPVSRAAGPRKGDLVAFGLAGEETMEIVIRDKGRPSAEGVVELTAEPYAHPEIDNAGSGVAPAFNSTIRRAWSKTPPTPTLAAKSWTFDAVTVDFAVAAASDLTLDRFEVRWRQTPAAGEHVSWERLAPLQGDDRRATTPPPGLAWSVDVEITAVDLFGRRGAPLTVTAAATPTIPGDVAEFDLYPGEDLIRFVWSRASASSPIEYVIREGETWTNSVIVARTTAQEITVKQPVAITTERRFWIKAVTLQDSLESINARFRVTAQAALANRNIVLSRDLRALDWPGVTIDLAARGVSGDQLLVLAAPAGVRRSFGDYITEVDLGQHFFARNWIESLSGRVVGTSPIWDALTMTWDELGGLTWDPPIVATDDALVQARIAIDTAPTDFDEGFRLNLLSCLGVNGTIPTRNDLLTQRPCRLALGAATQEYSAIAWTLPIDPVFTLLFDFLPTEAAAADGLLARLDGAAGTFLELTFEAEAGLLVAEDDLGQRVELIAPTFAPDDVLTFALVQDETERRLMWTNRGLFVPTPGALDGQQVGNSGMMEEV